MDSAKQRPEPEPAGFLRMVSYIVVENPVQRGPRTRHDASPAAGKCPTASAADWEQAARLDPDAFGADDAWNLDLRCYAIRRPVGRIILVDTGVGPAGSPASGWAPVPGHLPERLVEAGRHRTLLATAHLKQAFVRTGRVRAATFPGKSQRVASTVRPIGFADGFWRQMLFQRRLSGAEFVSLGTSATLATWVLRAGKKRVTGSKPRYSGRGPAPIGALLAGPRAVHGAGPSWPQRRPGARRAIGPRQ